MCKDKIMVNMGFTDEKFPAGTHMCLIFSDEEERKKIISKYLDGGYSAGEKVSCFADEMSLDEVKSWLKDMGLKISDNDKTGRFSVARTADTYYPNGIFEPKLMLDNLKDFHTNAKKEGYPASRVTGETSWALKGIPGSDRLMEYEAKVNDILDEYPVTSIC
ncbi:MAG: MEDS domain-containing protein [Bacteroidales bacterium]|jgi:hypothetical protein|nr:MEDS domain-containing protein [Bacteroidales bacterium]